LHRLQRGVEAGEADGVEIQVGRGEDRPESLRILPGHEHDMALEAQTGALEGGAQAPLQPAR
jgi:hypothetical protein